MTAHGGKHWLKLWLLPLVFSSGCGIGYRPSSFDADLIPRTGANADQVLYLQSNVNCHYFIDGQEIASGKRVRIGVTEYPHQVVCKPDEYRAKEEYVQPPFDPYQPIGFTFLIEDKIQVLTAGRNESISTMRTVASDVDNIPASRASVPERDAVALVIGISKYRESIIPAVTFARRDAETMASYLEAIGGVPRSKIKLMTDEAASWSDLSAYVEEWLPRRVTPDTTVFLYYAGHGMPNLSTGQGYLLPYDGHPDFTSKLYSLDRLYQKLDALPAKEVVVMLDSCFSGAPGRSVFPHGARPAVITVESPVLTSKKIVVLAAATGSQMSSDYDKGQHGLFTYFLLNGLKGEADINRNGSVEISELYEYASKRVPKIASEELNRDQTPILLPSPHSVGILGNVRVSIAGR